MKDNKTEEHFNKSKNFQKNTEKKLSYKNIKSRGVQIIELKQKHRYSGSDGRKYYYITSVSKNDPK